MTNKTHIRRGLAGLLTVVMLFSLVPAAFAAQENGYHDPAEHWLTANNRTNELDANAVVTRETGTCHECGKPTLFKTFRVPEYTRDGQTAMLRNVRYSDGTTLDGEGKGAVNDGIPGVNAYYTGFHWTKSCCEICGTMNSNMGEDDYSYGKNVYWLYDCAAEFMEDLDESVSYEYADDAHHTKTVKGGTYCCFCYGTHHTGKSSLERHDLNREIVPELAHQRFIVKDACSLCSYEKKSYTAAKSVVADYYGEVDGKPHTLTVTDLSEAGVSTQIRYGNSAESCTMTSAPNYTEAGQYTVYYEITYTYKSTSMTENGVAYVWLHEESTGETCPCGCGDPDCGCSNQNCGGSCCKDDPCKDNHRYVLLDSVKASCLTLGYDRYLCTECGKIEKRDYTNALGHSWQGVVVRDATCEENGRLFEICSRCGDSYKGEYADATGHKMGDWITDKEPTTDSEGSRHKECEHCGKTLETESTPKLYQTATTDTHGEAIVGGYLVIVTDTDTKNPVSGAGVALDKAGGISIRLPNSRLLDYADKTTVTVLLSKDKAPVPDMQLAVTDKNGNYCAEKTDKAGQITVPGTSGSTNGDGKATGGYEDADRERHTLTVKVEDYETGRPIENAGVSIGKTGKITVTLPAGVDMDERNRITVTVTDHRKQPQEGLTVLVKGDLKQTAEGMTDENGKLTVPAVTVTEHHGAYIYGYPDGTFGAERGMTRSEAAAIFGRLLADKNGDTITAARTKFSDVPANSWYSGYVKYLTGYGIAYGCGDNRFDPDRAITRAEFTAMAVRFFDAYGEGADELMEKYSGFDDVSSGYWAAEYIKDAALHGWIFGYGDGTFRGERSITRAEVVAIVNRLLGRTADREYIAGNIRRLNTFTDMDKGHWAYYDVMEAANSHKADMTDTEEWGG